MSNQIEIHLDAKKLTPERFIEAVKSFFDIVEGVTGNITGSKKTVEWIVEVDKGSAVVRTRAANPSRQAEDTVDAVCRGMRSLRTGVRTIPHGFTSEEVRSTKNLAGLLGAGRIDSIAIRNGNEPEPLCLEMVTVADAILSGEKFTAFGSIEGKIDSMSDKDAFVCSILSPAYGREITCYFQKPEVIEETIKAFRKRVMANGLIRYAKEGYPTSIVVDKIRQFPEESELPTIEEIQAIFK